MSPPPPPRPLVPCHPPPLSPCPLLLPHPPQLFPRHPLPHPLLICIWSWSLFSDGDGNGDGDGDGGGAGDWSILFWRRKAKSFTYYIAFKTEFRKTKTIAIKYLLTIQEIIFLVDNYWWLQMVDYWLNYYEEERQRASLII